MNGTDKKYRVEFRLETTTFYKAQAQQAYMRELFEKFTSISRAEFLVIMKKIVKAKSCVFQLVTLTNSHI